MNQRITIPSQPIHQTGTALMVSLVLLFSITMISLHSAKVGVLEQRTASNEYRALQAQQAAEAGIDLMLTSLLDTNQYPTLVARNGGTIATSGNFITGPLDTDQDRTYNTTVTNPVNGNFAQLSINSLGCADTCSGNCNANCPTHRQISQLVSVVTGVANAPRAPLASMGNVNLSGNILIENTSGIIISGGAETAIQAAGAIIGAGAAKLENGGGQVLSGAWGSPVIRSGDPSLPATSDDFFKEFFGNSKTTVMASAEVMLNCNSCNNGDLDSAIGNSSLVWADGDLSLTGNSTFGSQANPVTLIVDGNLQVTGTVTFWGLIYFIGDWNGAGAGNVVINGALAVEGNLTANGNPNIAYNPTVLQNLQSTPFSITKVSGGWSDYSATGTLQ